MFGLFKRTAQSAGRLLFLDTLRAVRAAPVSDQVLIATRLMPQIEELIVACQSHPDAGGLLHFKLGVATAHRRTAVGAGASHSADPAWAVASLMESWCLAALAGAETLEQTTLAIDAWSTSVGRPLQISTIQAGESGLAASETAAPPRPGAERRIKTVRNSEELLAYARRTGATSVTIDGKEIRPRDQGADGASPVNREPAHMPTAVPPSASTTTSAVRSAAWASNGTRFGCHKCSKAVVLDDKFECSRFSCPVSRA